MCAPSLMSAVREELSRRHFLGVLGGSAAALAVGANAQTPARPLRLAKGFRDTFDLTHTLSNQTPVFPAFGPMRYVEKFTIAKDGFGCGELTFNEHAGDPHGCAAPLRSRAGDQSIGCRSTSSSRRSRWSRSRRASTRTPIRRSASTTSSPGRSSTAGFPPAPSWRCPRAADIRIGDSKKFLNADATTRCARPDSAARRRSS